MNNRTEIEENYVEEGSARLHGITDGFNLWDISAQWTKTGLEILHVQKGEKHKNAPGKAESGRNRVRFGCEKTAPDAT